MGAPASPFSTFTCVPLSLTGRAGCGRTRAYRRTARAPWAARVSPPRCGGRTLPRRDHGSSSPRPQGSLSEEPCSYPVRFLYRAPRILPVWRSDQCAGGSAGGVRVGERAKRAMQDGPPVWPLGDIHCCRSTHADLQGNPAKAENEQKSLRAQLMVWLPPCRSLPLRSPPPSASAPQPL